MFIGIPFHRGIAYLEEAIRSVMLQTNPDWELVVADDGTSDQGVGELLTRLGDRRIRYIRNVRNLGMVRNWNQLLDLAPPDALVTLLHADDRLLPDYVDRMSALASDAPDTVAYFCGATIIDAEGEPAFSTVDFAKSFYRPRGRTIRLCGERGLAALMKANFIMCPTLCFRKAKLGERRFSPEWMQVQDLEFTARLLLENESLVGLRDSAYEYRRHAESATTRQSESFLRFREESRCFELINRKCLAAGWTRAATIARRKTIIKLHILFRILKCLGSLRMRPVVAHFKLLAEVSSGRTA